MEEKEAYKTLVELYKDKEQWSDSIDYVAGLISAPSDKIKAKALWVFGEIGLQYPKDVTVHVPRIEPLLKSQNDLVRERAVTALGRIGRADFSLISPFFLSMFVLANDSCPKVRLAVIWASENIAVNTPFVFKEQIDVFAKLLEDENDRVRIEAPEIFRVLGKRIPDYVFPYLNKLMERSEYDSERVVRIHAKGAIKAILGK